MSVALAILQFFVIAFICFQEARRKSPVVFLWATLMIMFGIMHPFGMLSGAAEYSPAAMDDASVFVLVFCIIYIGARELSVMALNVDFGSRLAWKNLAPKCREDRGKGIALLFLIVISYMIISFASQSIGWNVAYTPNSSHTAVARSMSKPTRFPLSSRKPMGANVSSRPMTSSPFA